MIVKALSPRYTHYAPVELPKDCAMGQAVEMCLIHFNNSNPKPVYGLYKVEVKDEDSNRYLEVDIKFSECKIVSEESMEDFLKDMDNEPEAF